MQQQILKDMNIVNLNPNSSATGEGTESTDFSTIEQRLMALRVAEMTAKDELTRELKKAASEKFEDGENFWQKCGHSNLRDYCIQELSYTPLEARDILIKLGQIITRDRMTSTDPVVQQRIQKLISWRRKQALQQGIAAFRILGNRTVLLMAETGPKNIEELCKIKGIGPVKLQSYGDSLIEALS